MAKRALEVFEHTEMVARLFGGSGWSTAMGDTTAGVPRDPKDVSDFMADVLIDADGWRLGEPL